MLYKKHPTVEFNTNIVYSIVAFLRRDCLEIPFPISVVQQQLLLQVIAHHGLTSYILSHPNFSNLNGSLQSAIKRLYLTTSVRNTQLFETYHSITRRFKEQEIEYVPLKGAFLLQTIYGDIAARNISDLDILIHPNDYERCKTILVEMGAIQLEADSESFLQNLGNHYSAYWLFNTSIELHFRILPLNLRYTIPVSEVWNNLVDYSFESTSYIGIEPNLQIIYLAMHIHYSEMRGEYRVYWYMDIAKVIEKDSRVNMDTILKLSHKYGNQKPLLKVLSKVAYLFNISIKGVRDLNDDDILIFTNNLSLKQKPLNKGYSIALERVIYTKGFKNKLRFIKQSIANGSGDTSMGLFNRLVSVGKKLLQFLIKRR